MQILDTMGIPPGLVDENMENIRISESSICDL